MKKYIHHVCWCSNDVGHMLTDIMILHIKGVLFASVTLISNKKMYLLVCRVYTLCVPHVFGLNVYLY
jgi:hypothetical protein